MDSRRTKLGPGRIYGATRKSYERPQGREPSPGDVPSDGASLPPSFNLAAGAGRTEPMNGVRRGGPSGPTRGRSVPRSGVRSSWRREPLDQLGCDALYEQGFASVDDRGKVVTVAAK